MESYSDTTSHARDSILIVDDDRKLCRLIHDYLEPVGYEVSAAQTGPEGLVVEIKLAVAQG